MNPLPDAQRKAALVVGVSYLLGMGLWLFSAFVRGRLIIADDVAQTARLIGAHTGLFRLGIAAEILSLATAMVRIIALYLILAPVHRPLAWFATVTQLAGHTALLTLAAQGLQVVRIPHTSGYEPGFVMSGIGSAAFAWLWMKSSYVPRGLAFLGFGASTLLAIGNLEIMVAPFLRSLFYPWFMAPLFFFQVGMAVWLLTRLSPSRDPLEHHGDALISTAAR